MRLIDADALIEKTDCLFKDLNSTEDYMGIGYNHGVGDSMAIIKNFPTIKAEPEIIRCKDCLMHGVCRFEQWLGLDGYCSQAERRIDE